MIIKNRQKLPEAPDRKWGVACAQKKKNEPSRQKKES